MIYNTDNQEIINLYNDMIFIRQYERYLIDIYDNLLLNNILICQGENYKFIDNNNSFTDIKRREANNYILENYLFDKEALKRYNKIIGNKQAFKLYDNLEIKKNYNQFKWFNKYKLMKTQLKQKINELNINN